MLTHSRLGNYGRLGNQLFQIASILSVGDACGQEVVFPEWKYAQFLDASIPVGTVENAQIYEERQFSHYDLPVAQGAWDLIGYFQSEKYFDVELVKKQFRFTDALTCNAMARLITPANDECCFQFDEVILSTIRNISNSTNTITCRRCHLSEEETSK